MEFPNKRINWKPLKAFDLMLLPRTHNPYKMINKSFTFHQGYFLWSLYFLREISKWTNFFPFYNFAKFQSWTIAWTSSWPFRKWVPFAFANQPIIFMIAVRGSVPSLNPILDIAPLELISMVQLFNMSTVDIGASLGKSPVWEQKVLHGFIGCVHDFYANEAVWNDA